GECRSFVVPYVTHAEELPHPLHEQQHGRHRNQRSPNGRELSWLSTGDQHPHQSSGQQCVS
ncbi:hypothetical protein, partial [Escherichia coli]|uniref:hypothetical protein n=1 Tax=Escherichia coli TaxID=562 RepID=UPI0013D7CBAE